MTVASAVAGRIGEAASVLAGVLAGHAPES